MVCQMVNHIKFSDWHSIPLEFKISIFKANNNYGNYTYPTQDTRISIFHAHLTIELLKVFFFLVTISTWISSFIWEYLVKTKKRTECLGWCGEFEDAEFDSIGKWAGLVLTESSIFLQGPFIWSLSSAPS